MPNTSISGLVSGLDTATIISQLMQIEARPQTLLKTKVSTEQKVVTALQGLNSKLAALTTKAGDLAKTTAWSPTTATSSNDKVTVTSTSSASPTTLTFDVLGTASASRALYTSAMDPSAQATTAGSITVTYADSSQHTIALADTSLQGVADAINKDTAAGLTATLVRAGGTDTNPTYQLQVTSTATGSASGFSLDDGSGSFLGGATSSTGTDARIRLPGDTADRTFSSNTITGLMPGVDVTLQAGATGSTTITVERDVQSLSDSVKGLVDGINGILDEIGKQTAYDADTKTGGLLTGDSTVRDVRNRLLEAVTNGVGGTSLATVGIQVDRYGKLTFDEAKFKSAYAADPAGTQALIAGTDPASGTDTGFADRLAALGKAFSDSYDGTLTLSIQSHQAGIKGMQDDIAGWDVRLADRQTTLQRQYTALETALGKLQNQSSWLAGQISSLPTISSGG